MGCGNIKPINGFRCFNLVQNPSFEAGLTNWVVSDNVTTTDGLPFGGAPFEGTQVASMSTGVAHLFQDVSLANTDCSPLFLSFNAISQDQPKMTVDVLWLDGKHQIIGYGLSMFIPEGTTNEPEFSFNARITFFDITDTPPPGAVFARLLFSKDDGDEDSFVTIDQVILAPISTTNLAQNPSFELGLTHWTGPTFTPEFISPLQGAANVITSTAGTLFQDVSIEDQPVNSSYLLSFGVFSEELVSLNIQVQWLDALNNIIMPPGLDMNIPSVTLRQQANYLTYLNITNPAPNGAVKARILFDPVFSEEGTLAIDQILFARANTANLVENFSFEEGLNNWTQVGTTLYTNNDVYEGASAASIGQTGGMIFQDIPITNAVGNCFLLSFGLRVRYIGLGSTNNVLVRVSWLDDDGNVIGLGLNLVCFSSTLIAQLYRWLVYTGITEPAPPGTVAARIQFTKLAADHSTALDIDNIVFGSLV